jgi:outer membrane biosynthesis protein TonB
MHGMHDKVRLKKTSRVSVVISAVFHAILIGTLAYFAAKGGMLGTQLQRVAVNMVKKEPPKVEKPVEKPPEVKPIQEDKKPDMTPVHTQVQLAAATEATTERAPAAPAEAAPEAVQTPEMYVPGGAAVDTSSSPTEIYRNYIEYSLRKNWDRPDNLQDDNFVAEVAVDVSPDGDITGSEWQKGSGNTAWDNSVKKALSQTTSIGRAPPKGFPPRVIVRFDVVSAAAESTIQ